MAVIAISDTTIPAGEPLFRELGTLNAGSYTAEVVGTLRWTDPAQDGIENVVALAVDIDAFEMNGDPMDWDSGCYFRVDEIYVTQAGAPRTRPLSMFCAFVLPKRAKLTAMVLDQSGRSLVSDYRFTDGILTLLGPL